MTRPLPFELGAATGPTFWFVAGVLFTLIFTAVFLEYRRRRKSNRQQILCERRLVDEIADDKQFNPEEKKALRSLIDKHSPETPLALVKDRATFDRAVQQEIEAAEAKRDEHLLAQTGLVLRAIREKLDFQYVPVGQRIWSTRELYEGQVVWLGTEAEPSKWYESAVSAVDEAFLHLTLIGARAAQDAPFAAGSTVRCRLWREDDARYIFSLRVTACGGQPMTCALRHTSELNRMQAREYFRVHYSQDTDLALLESHKAYDAEISEAEVQQEPRIVARWPAHFMSLSAGGFGVIARKPLPVDVSVRIRIELPGEEPFDTMAKTVGAEVLPGERHLIRGQFTDITEDKRDLIARYVTQRQQPSLAQQWEQAAPDRRE